MMRRDTPRLLRGALHLAFGDAVLTLIQNFDRRHRTGIYIRGGLVLGNAGAVLGGNQQNYLPPINSEK